jgi:hypothetical protein
MPPAEGALTFRHIIRTTVRIPSPPHTVPTRMKWDFMMEKTDHDRDIS